MFFNFSQNGWTYYKFQGRRGAVRQILPFARNHDAPEGRELESHCLRRSKKSLELICSKDFWFGVFRRGNNPPVLPGEENERSKKRKGELKASPQN